MYDAKSIKSYQGKSLGVMPPHCYAVGMIYGAETFIYGCLGPRVYDRLPQVGTIGHIVFFQHDFQCNHGGDSLLTELKLKLIFRTSSL